MNRVMSQAITEVIEESNTAKRNDRVFTCLKLTGKPLLGKERQDNNKLGMKHFTPEGSYRTVTMQPSSAASLLLQAVLVDHGAQLAGASAL
jgi:hypothetical protein